MRATIDFSLIKRLGPIKNYLVSYFVWRMRADLAGKSANLRDGKHWVYETHATLARMTCVCKTTVKARLKELEDEGIIETGNYNKMTYDRTKWYTVVDKDILIKLGFEKTTTLNKSLTDVPEDAVTLVEIPDKYKELCADLEISQRCYSWLTDEQLDVLHEGLRQLQFLIKSEMPEKERAEQITAVTESKLEYLKAAYDNRNNKKHESYKKQKS